MIFALQHGFLLGHVCNPSSFCSSHSEPSFSPSPWSSAGESSPVLPWVKDSFITLVLIAFDTGAQPWLCQMTTVPFPLDFRRKKSFCWFLEPVPASTFEFSRSYQHLGSISLFSLYSNTQNHSPLGRFAPGFIELGNFFGNLWREASKNREKWGCRRTIPFLPLFIVSLVPPSWCTYQTDLGKTQVLLGTDDPAGNTMVWLSYWKSLPHLRAFTAGDLHRASMKWYLENYRNKYPHMGLMHEVFAAPAGSWQSIYYNFRPFALGESLKAVVVLRQICS